MVDTVIGREKVKDTRGQAIGRTVSVDTEITKSYVVLESDNESGSRIFQVCEGVDFLQWGKKTGLVLGVKMSLYVGCGRLSQCCFLLLRVCLHARPFGRYLE